MKNLRQDIRIFQDAQDNKTTIVCWNLSKQTKEKLFQILLEDVQTVETITGVTNTPPDLSNEVKNTASMTPVDALDAAIAGKAIDQQAIILCSMYEKNNDPAIPAKIKSLMPTVYESHPDTIRNVLYALRNMSGSTLDSLADQMGYGNTQGRPDRDQVLVQVLGATREDMLPVVLKAIMGD